ncbi:SHOCT domain-containing protein [Thalassospiraceae bacterium LMO-JJ14]|nr:SHOCT domain-containing protein [Thalassospiraceae bacterium LMO-JJ14]
MRTSFLSALMAGGTTMAASGLAHAQGYGYGYSDHPMMWNGMLMGPMMMILMTVVIAVAIVLVLKFLGVGGGGNHGKDVRDNSLAILNERFAKGEIDSAEYEERKKTLGA